MNSIKKEIKWWVNKLFFRAYRYRRIERRHLLPHYTADAPASTSDERIAVMMFDGKRKHGGLADRLRGIIFCYSICREEGIGFRLNFTFPFNLETYLQPNLYDWTLKPGELSFNITEARPVFTDTIGISTVGISGQREAKWQRDYIRKRLNDADIKQLHVYTPFVCTDEEFSLYFHELFRPSPLLENALKPYREMLGDNYISISTRFMELLGDFHEPKAKIRLTSREQDMLIDKCLKKVLEIHQKHPGKRVLVTSDSMKFLTACSALPWVYVVEGEIAHSDTADTDNHLKTFLDFWLISEAKEVYQLKTDRMYAGNFSYKAANINQRPFHLIEF